MSLKRIFTPERKHRLRWIGESVFLGAVFLVFWALIFLQERDKIYSAQDRLLSVYAIYTELMFADIDDMIYRISKPYFGVGNLKIDVMEEMWRGRQNDDPMLRNVVLLDKNKEIVFALRKTSISFDRINAYIDKADKFASSKGVYVSEPFFGDDNDEWYIAFLRVFDDDEGNLAGYAIAVFNLDVITQRYERLRGNESAAIALLSASGRFIAGVPQGEADSYYGRAILAYDDFSKKGGVFGKRLKAVMTNDEKAIVSFAPINAYNMTVACATPYEAVYKLIALTSAGFAIAWLTISFALRKISRRLFLEEQTARLIERETRLKLESRAEEALIKQLEAEQSKREHEKIMVQQSKMAAMGEMIGAIAHQWRQPLHSIGLYIQDILDARKFGQLNDEYLKNSVDKTMWQLKFMSSTIDDFSNFFKPDKAKTIFDLSKVAQNSIALVAAQLKSADIDFSFEIPNEPLWCDGYENELGQAMLNLINNAKDAILERRKRGKKRKIVVRLTRDEQKARLEVEDNGGGVPPELMDRVFEPYFTTKDNDKGTGIGLYMSKMIVENNMNGVIGVQNGAKGARFFIILPIARVG
ncbi:MAG: sensor histidine kinase [Helicobacteraceae bacterium]|nr:sensor histidine kinase [Helicobacteraceae bacterium]